MPDPSAAPALAGFPPVIGSSSTVLILGSFPGAASLDAGHYYAHPRNLFWPILGELFGQPLERLDFAERYRIVVERGLAIWDVLSACRRDGSLDSGIRHAQANDFSCLRGLAPGLRKVFFNGQLAGRFAPRFAAEGYDIEVLPSTSPAFAAMPAAERVIRWTRAIGPWMQAGPTAPSSR